MLRKFLLLFTFAFFFPVLLMIHAGGHQEKDKEELVLYEYLEPWFNIEFPLDTLMAKDSFLFQQESGRTRSIYFDYGPLRCHFFAQPGIKYIVRLPDLSSKGENWKNDSYFEPLPYHADAQPEKTTEFKLNKAIRDFNEEYEPFLSQQTLRYFKPEYAMAQLDSFIEENYRSDDSLYSEFFYHYKRYKKAVLLFHLKQQNKLELIEEYLLGQKARFHNPSYRTFFSLVMPSYFEFLKRTDEFSDIYQKFARLSPSLLHDYLRRDSLLCNDTIRNMVILKEAYDAFYSEKLSQKKIISFTDSIFQNADITIVSKVAGELMNKFTHLRPGYPAPPFTVTTATGDSIRVDSTNQKIIYLGFCDLNSIQCLQEVEYIKYLCRKHGKYLQIISFLKPCGQLKELKMECGDNWIVLPWEGNEHVARLYDIRAYPTFYLIDKGGIMLRSPAPNPSENFEYKLFQILRAKGIV